MPSTMNEFLEGALEGQKLDEIESPQMFKKLKSLNTEFLAIKNQLKMDGHDKEADQFFLKAGDLIRTVKKVYK